MFIPFVIHVIIKKALLDYGLEGTNYVKCYSFIFCKSVTNCKTVHYIYNFWIGNNFDHRFFQILWTFSIYLEAVAILPQLFMISKTGEAESITTHYLFCLACYRALYILNWIYRFYTEHYFDLIAVVAGAVQTILYADFVYLYITKGEINTGLSYLMWELSSLCQIEDNY